MYFFSEQDPNFRIKGSRDPLGFQSIWQSLGRNVIKYLSTVSINIKDFQVLSYAWYFYGDRDPNHFLKFFYKFEQACGYARGIYFKNDFFNGIDFVRKNIPNEPYSFSTNDRDTLLSNQKSYGIFGKYNRPYSEMKIKEHKEFSSIMEEALKSKVNFPLLKEKVDRLIAEDVTIMNKEDLEIFAQILDTLSENEKAFYRDHILKVNGDHVQNELFQLLNTNSELINSENFNLFSFINSLNKKELSDELRFFLNEIVKSEQVLVPYVYLFKTLQSKPFWEKEQISSESIFNSIPQSQNHHFSNNIVDDLNNKLNAIPYELALSTVHRNQLVSEKRKNAAWIKIEFDKLITCYADGAKKYTEFDIESSTEHNYFLPSYISLYKQILN